MIVKELTFQPRILESFFPDMAKVLDLFPVSVENRLPYPISKSCDCHHSFEKLAEFAVHFVSEIHFEN